MDIRVRTDLAPATEGFKAVRRDANRAMRSGMVQAANRAVLPYAKQIAPHKRGRLAASLIARRAGGGVILTTSLGGKLGRMAGLLEYGGTVRKEIRPRRKRARSSRARPAALAFGGRFAANVKTPRHYRARRFLTRAAEARRDEFGQELVPSILATFREAGFEVSR